jgi:hypothetical protein
MSLYGVDSLSRVPSISTAVLSEKLLLGRQLQEPAPA